MPRLIALLVLLAACAAPLPPTSGYWTAVPIYSNATFDHARMAGTWHQAATFGVPRCPGGRLVVQPGLAAQGTLCAGGRQVAIDGTFQPSGPGRVRIAAPAPLDGEWWMLWVDADYRTLAVGTPGGGFGFILNRDGPVPPDRLAAARELFEFNGYDLSHLTMLP